ncbi:MAG TPA: hypothetical protein VKX25_20565 [Bryobacteraceae bacterium]|nr:hypothetical protein [Bryobacteraceae bacterium]
MSAYDDALFSYSSAPYIVHFCGYSPAPCVGTQALPNTSLVASYDTYASAPAYGVYKAYGSMSLSPGPASTGRVFQTVAAGGVAVSDDTLTFSGRPTGTPGTFTVGFTISGSSSTTTGNAAGYGLWVYVVNTNQTYTISDNEGIATNPVIPMQFGVPIHIQTNFSAQATIVTLAVGSSALADYSDTAVLSSIAVYDQNGNRVPVDIVSKSGTVYTSDGVVPEPGEFLLLFCALGWLALVKRPFSERAE